MIAYVKMDEVMRVVVVVMRKTTMAARSNDVVGDDIGDHRVREMAVMLAMLG